MEIRKLSKNEINDSLKLVWRVFCEYEAVNAPEEEKEAFYTAIHSPEYLDTLSVYGAFINDSLIGIIAARDEGRHIALFFVDGKYHHQGIGRSLWNAMLSDSTANIITVNSSVFASEIYKKIGFSQTADIQHDSGLQYIPMEYLHFLDILQDKDDKTAYAKTKEIAAASEFSPEYYPHLEAFASLLSNKKSYIRTRAFILCCSQARWDTEGRLQIILPQMMPLLHDEKPTVVRQCLNAVKEIAVFRPELCEEIEQELNRMDLSPYKDSMTPLIQKDIRELRELIQEQKMMVESERLLLYPVSNGEMTKLIESESDPDMKQAYSEMLQGCINEPENRIWFAVWYIEQKNLPGTVIGDLCFKGLGADGTVEIGYGLRDGFCGHGFMTEALTAVTKWALAQPGVTRVEAETDPENTASQKVLANAGYIPTGTFGEEGPRFVYAEKKEGEKR